MRTRNRRIHIYLTDDELSELDRKVVACKMSREEYLRMILSGYSPREAPPVDYYNLISEVRRVGANINQILRVANAKGFIDAPLLRQTLDEHHKTEKMIWRAFGVEKM